MWVTSKIDFERSIPDIREKHEPDDMVVIKLAGCGDRYNLEKFNGYNLHRIVCPMVENDYHVKKFMETVGCKYNDATKVLLIETKEGIEYLRKHLTEKKKSELLNQFTEIEIGLSDLQKSTGYSEKYLFEWLKQSIEKTAKKVFYRFSFGGKMTGQKAAFIKQYFKELNVTGFSTRYHYFYEVISENTLIIDAILNKEKNRLKEIICAKQKDMAKYIKEFNEIEGLLNVSCDIEKDKVQAI